MGILDWLQSTLAGKAVPLTFHQAEEEFAGLNMRQAIDAHMVWRTHLVEILDGKSSEWLEAADVARDNVCVLGRWIHGSALASFGHFPEFVDLRKAHADFHQCAADVLIKARDGGNDLARAIVKGPLGTFSDRVQLDIIRLYAATQK